MLTIRCGLVSGFKIDPRTKLLLMLLVNMTIFGGRSLLTMIPMALLPLSLLYASGKKGSAVKWLIIYGAAVIVNSIVVPNTTGLLNVLSVMVGGMFYRMLPGFIMGYYVIATTTVSEFTASMARMHVPDAIVIPMSVMFRFFPTIGEEAASISDAMRMRGIGMNLKSLSNPISVIEYRMVPLLISTVKIGQDLTIAALTRGLGGTEPRTHICQIGLTYRDYLYALFGIMAYVSGFILK